MKLAAAVSFCLLVLLARPAHAAAPTLSGRWSATAMSVQWQIGDWGEACGPKPAGGGAPSGTVTVQQKGSELYISGAGRSWSTLQCWEQLPGMRVSHKGGSRGWSNVCKSSPGDPRQATVNTNVTASDDFIGFSETGQYQFVIKGQNCTASVRRTRTFKLIQREGEAPPKAPEPEPVKTTPKPEPEPAPARCIELGPPATFEVRPSRKLIRAGEEFTFKAKVLDAAGCPLAIQPAWRLVGEAKGVTLGDRGLVRVAADAGEQDVPINVTVAGRSVEVVLEIVSRERYEALLRRGGFNEAGESEVAAVTAIASGSIGQGTAAVEDRSSGRRKTFVAVVGALAALFGLIGLVLVLRTRRREREAARAAQAGAAPETIAVSTRAPLAMVCPTCREEYPPDAQFCPTDGNRLVRLQEGADPRAPAGGVCPVCGQGYDPGIVTCPTHDEELVPPAVYLAMRDSEPAIEKKICPVCGAQYPGQSGFCGTDGAALVPVN